MVKNIYCFCCFFLLILCPNQYRTSNDYCSNALYFEDYVLSIQYFNQVINAKPYLYEPYFLEIGQNKSEDYQGAETDCSAAIERNPFVVGAYQIRGLARIKQSKFEGAISDYKTALQYEPENMNPVA